MKITFNSVDEINKFCHLLKSAFPADIVIDLDDLEKGKEHGEFGLPWNWDGLHLESMIKIEIPDEAQPNKESTVEAREKLYTHEELYKDCAVYEAVEKDGKKLYRRIVPAGEALTFDEKLCYEAGRLEAIFRLYMEDQMSLLRASAVSGRSRGEFVDLLRIWSRCYENAVTPIDIGEEGGETD